MSVETNENINSVNGNIYNPENIVKDVITPNTGEVTTDTIVVDFQATQRINILSELLKDEVARGNQQGIISQKNGMLNNDNNNVIPLNKQDNELITNIINSSSENSAEQLAQSENFSNADLSNKNVLETPNETIEQKNNENTQDILQNTDVDNKNTQTIQQDLEINDEKNQENTEKIDTVQQIKEEGTNTIQINSVNNLEAKGQLDEKNNISDEQQNLTISKEKQHVQDKKDYRLERMLFDRINAMQGKIKESIELIQKFERINAKEENLPNIVTTLHDKLTHEVIKQFRTVGIEFNMKSYLVQSVVSDLLGKFEEGITEFKECSENLNFVREVQDDFESKVELAPTSKVKNIFARLRGMFKPERKQEKLEELERERQKKKLEEANIHLIRYKFINGELERYTIKNNIIGSLRREILHSQGSGQNLNVSEFVDEKIAHEMKKLGLEELIPQLLQSLYNEYREKYNAIGMEDFTNLQIGEIRRNLKNQKGDAPKKNVGNTTAIEKIEMDNDERMVV